MALTLIYSLKGDLRPEPHSWSHHRDASAQCADELGRCVQAPARLVLGLLPPQQTSSATSRFKRRVGSEQGHPGNPHSNRNPSGARFQLQGIEPRLVNPRQGVRRQATPDDHTSSWFLWQTSHVHLHRCGYHIAACFFRRSSCQHLPEGRSALPG